MTRTPPPVITRLARVEDADLLNTIIDSSYRGAGGWTTEEHLIIGKRISADQLVVMLMDESTFEIEPIIVAELVTPDEFGNRVIGCIQPSKGVHGAISAHTAHTPDENKEPVNLTIPIGDADGEREITLVPAVPDMVQPPPPKDSEAMFGLFGVLPVYQSKGIGRILVESALKHIKEEWKCKKCVLWVLETRPELLAWYEKLGFKWNGEMMPFNAPELQLKRGDFRVLELLL